MRSSIRKTAIISMLSSLFAVVLMLVGNQAFAADKHVNNGQMLNSKSHEVMQIAKGQRYKPLDQIYRKQC